MSKVYSFDDTIERRGSGALKVDALQERYGRGDIVGMWVADMDFATPTFITDAIRQRLDHPVFGYTIEPADYRPTICDWLREHHNWEVKPEWIGYIPGIVKGIAMAVNFFCGSNASTRSKVIIQPPVYHPFRFVIEGCGHEVVFNPLREVNGTYEMDFDNLEKVIDGCSLLILSNPHNPAGVTWSTDTLQRLAHLCYEHRVIVISDEIHCDLAIFGNNHVPFATVSDEARAISITFGAPSKTFNMAGIVSSYAIIPDDSLRRRFYTWLDACEFSEAPIFAHIATIAAYKNGEEWRQQMLRYIEDNILFVEDFLAKKIPEIHPWRPQASFLVWLDCRALGLNQRSLVSLFVDKAHLALNDGTMFGTEGTGFMRLNIGCPRTTLAAALESLASAVRNE